jgi:hypothetical protein
MRSYLLLLASIVVLPLIGCSSDDEPAAGSQINACTSAGNICKVNFPLMCSGISGQYVLAPVDDPAMNAACGNSSDGKAIPCCKRVDPPDTGVADTGMADAEEDAMIDATDETSDDAIADADEDAADAADATDDAPDAD